MPNGANYKIYKTPASFLHFSFKLICFHEVFTQRSNDGTIKDTVAKLVRDGFRKRLKTMIKKARCLHLYGVDVYLQRGKCYEYSSVDEGGWQPTQSQIVSAIA
jgi:hypothetical protein